ncbi:MAG TPA: uroporphyrinogen-III synthase [Pusillimonas sp.]|uniref:uroporphyrinogen-III synthase n=1 Tax=unclassified Pusillimonas TaxID=2640016 RepID=UPI0026118079|nr:MULTISPECIES: uroporphyrinogen-III synthase [unclassified Pusillimonas]HLU19418.1 uroporphyrinogen-III synthase [Pusillimonas sp.]
MAGQSANALVLLTRPQSRNESLLRRLTKEGVEALAVPVLDIAPRLVDAASVPSPADFDLVVFVSGNALNCYLQQWRRRGNQRSRAWPPETRVAAVGAATARAVLDAGLVSADRLIVPLDDESQDSESLWRHLQTHTDEMSRVLIVRGQDGREWLGSRLEEAGLQVVRHASYERRTSIWPAAAAKQIHDAVSSGRPIICLLTSAHGVQAYSDNVQRHGLWPQCTAFHYVVIHPRVAGRLQSSLDALSSSGKVGELAVTICAPADDQIASTVMSLALR